MVRDFPLNTRQKLVFLLAGPHGGTAGPWKGTGEPLWSSHGEMSLGPAPEGVKVRVVGTSLQADTVRKPRWGVSLPAMTQSGWQFRSEPNHFGRA